MKALVAVSGGPDSMALLAYLEGKGIDYIACHVNYHHRETANRDEAIVRKWCKDHNKEVRVYSPVNPEGNFEGWAREERYRFFEEVGKEEKITTLYVGHNEDDLLETWMMQRERKTLPNYYGLKEETQRNILTIKRPLLKYTKRELQEYCNHNSIPYGIDETNLSDDYRRNQIRHSVVECADREKRNEWHRQMSDDNRALKERREHARVLAEENKAEVILADPDNWFILESIYHAKTGEHKSRKEMEEVVKQLKEQGRAKGICIDRSTGHLYLVQDNPEVKSIVINSKKSLEALGYIKKRGTEVEAFYVSDADYPLTIRAIQAEDVVEMRYGKKKVNKLLRDKKIPEAKRKEYRVIENSKGILFVEGSGCSVWNYQQGEKVYFQR